MAMKGQRVKLHDIRFKRVFRWDSHNKLLRLFRIMWERGNVGDGRGYSAKFSLACTPRIIGWHRGMFDWALTVLGLRVHYLRAYGGHIA